ncbi:MAG: helix-turn-helix domain-containing protein [Clostridia bacterium]|nr:helix-turn-helix domain-containing protein [Clostridia bacterium]
MPEFMTLQEVARALKVTVRSLNAWRKAGKITFVQIGKRNRISREELERFLAAGTVNNAERNAEG